MFKPCKIKDCALPHYAKDLCYRHYARKRSLYYRGIIQCLRGNTTGCVEPVRFQGLCQLHWQELFEQTKAGTITWDQAVEQGLCLAK
jgi:hypothetical protein